MANAGVPAKRQNSRNKPVRRNYPSSAKTAKLSKQAERQRQAASRYVDYSLIFVILFLLAFGLVMLYSTSSYEAAIEYGDGAYYLKKQLLSTLVGLAGMVICALIPYGFWKRTAWLIYALSAVLVLMIIPFGREVNGAKRWLYFGPVSLQPAEVCKVAVILVTAKILAGIQKNKLRNIGWFILTLVPAGLQAVLIYQITKNLSSAIIIAAIAVGMLFVTTKDYWRYFLFGGIAAGGVGYWLYRTINSDGTSDMSFRSERLLAWLDPEKYADGKGFQILQGLYGIGSGGMFGKGLGMSMQKLGYIPEAQNDMIFSIICEELGVFGAVSIMVMFIILCWRFMLIASNSEDLFGSLLVVGVMTHIAVQVVLNIAVVTNTIPNTGVSLPFISYGGSSVLFLLAEVGMTLSVARSIRFREL